MRCAVESFVHAGMSLNDAAICINLTLLEPPGFGDFRKKTQQFSVALPTP